MNKPLLSLFIHALVSFNLLYITSINAVSSEVKYLEKRSKKHIHGTHKECPLPENIIDIVECAMTFHPSVKRGLLKLDVASTLKEKALQRPNPTLNSRYVKGSQNGNDVSEFETNLTFTLELGGKRDSRKKYALAQKGEAIAANESIKSHIKTQTILNLYRLRQVYTEKEIINEALRAFSKVIKQLKKLPRLSSEQESSLILFEIALEETRVGESEIFEEMRKLEHYFHIATGHSLSEIKRLLPKAYDSWPKINDYRKNGTSPQIKVSEALSNLANKELQVQKSRAWPNLKVGPALLVERNGFVENKMIGVNIQVPLPLFQTNNGGKAYARSKLLKAQKNIVFQKAEEDHERLEQFKIYKSAVNILNKTMNKKEINRKHNRIERLYLRGVVGSSVFLDSLKQKMSYLKSRNHRELTAVKALWNIYNFDGVLLKEKI